MFQPTPRSVFLMTLAASGAALATGAQAGQNCTHCALYQGKPADQTGGCPLCGAPQVAGAGRCSAWAKRA